MEDVRRIKQELLRYGKKIVEKGLAVGPGGNISARSGEVVYVSSTGKPRFLTDKEVEGIENLEAEDYRKALLKGEML